jgi:adenylate cyclase
MGPRQVERRLTTILSADVVGYSRLMGEDETGTLDGLKAHREALIDPEVAAHGGRVVKLMGDGTLIEFASVVDALRCAVEIQNGIAERNTEVPEHKRILFRIGINLADVIVEGDDLYGDGVNIAARLEALAEPGGICISHTVHDQVRKRLDLTYRDLGEKTVKNIAEPVRAYQVNLRQAPRQSWPSGAPRPPRPESARASIAVLPFDNLSSDAGDSYLADGIASEIISLLSRVSELRVISRLASFAFRDRGAGPFEALRELGLNYALTGSVRRSGDRIRVIAELTEAAEQTQLWTHTYERRFEDLLEVQEELAEAIVIAFGGEYLRAEWRRAIYRPTDSLDAWGLVQKAKAMHIPDDRAAMAEALELAERAVATDAGYAGAQASLASILMQRVVNGFSEQPEADRKRALAAVDLATELAPADPTVLRTAGNVFSNCGEHVKAVRAFRRSVEFAPYDFHSWGRLARTLAYGGDPQELDEGHAILDRILATAPNHPMVPFWLYFKANAFARQDRYEEAAEFARKSIEARPSYSGAWVTLANAFGQLGRFEEARKAMDRATRANPAMTPAHLAAQIEVVAAGDKDHTEKALQGLKAAGLL